MSKITPAGHRTRNGQGNTDGNDAYKVGRSYAGAKNPINTSNHTNSPLQGGVKINGK